MNNELRIAELQALEAEGVTLPLPVEQIIEIEDAGGMVNLDTGKILWNGTEFPIGLTPTAFGEVIAHLLEVGIEVGL